MTGRSCIDPVVVVRVNRTQDEHAWLYTLACQPIVFRAFARPSRPCPGAQRVLVPGVDWHCACRTFAHVFIHQARTRGAGRRDPARR